MNSSKNTVQFPLLNFNIKNLIKILELKNMFFSSENKKSMSLGRLKENQISFFCRNLIYILYSFFKSL